MAAGLSPMFAQAAQEHLAIHIAALQNRAAALQCVSAFSAASQAPQAAPIDQCVAACKANTGRSPSECFDACNH